MEKSFYFILNPYTKRKSSAIIETINTFFNDKPHRFCISIWEDHITVAELVTIAKAKGYTSIVACGGDGTVREVGKSLVDSDHTLGIIPLGSGNGIANHFNIPKKINKALAILIDGKCRKMDVGRAHDFYFFGNIGFGIEAEFIRAYQQNKKHGLIGYFIAAIKAFYSFKYEDYLITNSQGKPIETITIYADHSGYVSRLKAVIKAFAEKKVQFEVKLVQLVKLVKNKKVLKMSKRAGDYILIQDLLKEVSSDVIRFVMLGRNNDVPLDFDIDLMLSKSKDNPVFYVNYAHARIVSVLKRARELKLWPLDEICDLHKKTLPFMENELILIRKLSEWPNVVRQAARYHEPHRIAFYLNEVASSFHSLYQSSSDSIPYRFIVEGSEELSIRRLALAYSAKIVIKNGLSLLGIVPLEEMY